MGLFTVKKKNDKVQQNSFIPNQNQETETFVYKASATNVNPQQVINNANQVNNTNQASGPQMVSASVNVNNQEKLDPNNNAHNEIPVNPVAPVEVVEVVEVGKLSIPVFLSMVLGMILTPSDTIKNNYKKFRDLRNAFGIYALVVLFSCLLSVLISLFISRVQYNISSSIDNFGFLTDPSLLFRQEIFKSILVALLCSSIPVIITAFIYYISSFINNKGVYFGSYLVISSLAIVPFIIAFVVLMPLISIFSSFLSFAIIIIGFLYSFTCFILIINDCLTHTSDNRKIFYNVFNVSLATLIISLIIYFSFNLIGF